jgi:acetyl esterase/lipase
VAGTEADLSTLLARLDPAAAPALYVCAGTEDPLHPQSVRFAELARAAGVSVSTAFGPGEHEWGYWDARIRDVLDWLPLPR